MVRNCFKLILVCSIAVMVPSCGHDQQLLSITVRPSGFVFEGYGAQGKFTALGTYIHPPETKDITSRVLWQIDIANFGTVDQTGLVTYTRTDLCGGGDVTATYYSNPGNPSAGGTVVGSATVKGANEVTGKCPPP